MSFPHQHEHPWHGDVGDLALARARDPNHDADDAALVAEIYAAHADHVENAEAAPEAEAALLPPGYAGAAARLARANTPGATAWSWLGFSI